MGESVSSRNVVLASLLEMEQGGYSNIVLNRSLKGSALSNQDKAFASRLFYGVIERKITLDYIIGTMVPRTPDIVVVCILRMGLYQLLYMNSVPDYTAANESVKLCTEFGKTETKGFVNAVLRTFIRNNKKIDLSKIKGKEKKLSIAYSCGEDVVKSLLDSLGEAETRQILDRSLKSSVLYARVNNLRTDTQTLIRMLEEEGVKASAVPSIPNCIRFDSGIALDRLQSFSMGLFHIQDLSSQIASVVATHGFKSGTILDLCAAPGGKTYTMAEQSGDNAVIKSFDNHDFKIPIIELGAKRLGLRSVQVEVRDAEKFYPDLVGADRVLCDVPCSGFGIISKKPEIKYKNKSDYKDISQLQLKILSNGAKYVKPGGILIYSTCTLIYEENQGVTDRFLMENPEFAPYSLPEFLARNTDEDEKNTITILPREYDSDGFYIATFIKLDAQEQIVIE